MGRPAPDDQRRAPKAQSQGEIMATSSITHNFVFDAESTQRFADQLEAAECDAQKQEHVSYKMISTREEFLAFMKKAGENGR